jgi:uncharacterized protein DUF4038/collagenase-like protein with putative collagen-binding domain
MVKQMKALPLPNYVNRRMLALVIALTSLGPLVARVSGAPPKASSASAPAYPLKVSANRRYLVDQNNVPFLIAGDVPQALVTMISTADAAGYLDNRRAHGFNAMWINVLTAGPYYTDSPENGSTYDGIVPFTGYLSGGTDAAHYDLSKPNEAYFARVDQMLALAADRGLVVFLIPIETGQWVPTLRNNGVAAAGVYGQYLGKRYKRFNNIIWLNGNDFTTWQTSGDDAVVQAVAKGIKSVAPEQLQTVELELGVAGISSFDDPTWVPIVSLNSTYTYSPTYIQMLHSYNQTPITPTYLVEAHYDLERVGTPSDYGTPPILRRQEYWTMLSGGAGQLYGNFYTWSLVSGWKGYIDTVGVTQLTIWKKFFSSLPWQDLVPDQDHTAVTAGLGTYGDLQSKVSQSDYCTAAKTSDGSFVVAYMPTAREITVNMASLKAPAYAKWFDPTNEAYKTIPGGLLANTGTRQFTPPGNNHDGDGDWVLVLDASGSTP